MIIRKATPEDAVEVCALLRRSITELCVQDHHNDPEILAKWAGTKTPELVALWAIEPQSTMLVACDDSQKILAVGAVTDDGVITLNYVHPDARFKGISRAMVVALEAYAAQKGCACCSLNSTGTARRFYLSCGYEEGTAKTGSFGNQVYEMKKTLLAQ